MADELMLICRTQSALCALPIDHVVETMRPLDVVPLEGVPSFVLGLSIWRGTAAPVIDLEALIYGRRTDEAGRFVSIRLEERVALLAVLDVLAVSPVRPHRAAELPPLLRDSGSQHIAALGSRDGQLLVMLNAARIVPDEVWEELRREGSR